MNSRHNALGGHAGCGIRQAGYTLAPALPAIGQSPDDVSAWLTDSVKLGEKSLGAVNVQAPNRRWGGTSSKWKSDKLAGYLSKYIGKDFDTTAKGKKRYWPQTASRSQK